jgi:hypothetical protein
MTDQVPRLPVALSEHVREVFRRVETAAADDFDQVAELRLVALVHEEPPESLPDLLGSTGLLDYLPVVRAVTGRFGRVREVRTEDDLRDFVETSGPHLAAILLFELAHEGRPTPEMERAARLGGLQPAFERWAARVARREHGRGPERHDARPADR